MRWLALIGFTLGSLKSRIIFFILKDIILSGMKMGANFQWNGHKFDDAFPLQFFYY